jgi:hypothetical protein
MKRIAVFLLILCAGCAAPATGTLLDDTIWGDVLSYFPASSNPGKPSVPPPAGSPGSAPPAAGPAGWSIVELE